MSTMLGPQSLVLATAMAVSTTVIFLAFSRHKSDDSPQQPLRSCLSSPNTKRRRQNKKVKFADNVKEPTPNGAEFRGKHGRKNNNNSIERSCRNELLSNGMPANRAALYNGILRDRSQRMECSSH